MDRRSAAWSTAVRRAFRCPAGYPALSRSPQARPVALHHPAARARRGEDHCPVCSRTSDGRTGDDRNADLPDDRESSTSALRIIPTSATSSAPGMPITPIRRNTAFAIIAAAGARRRAKRQAGSRPARSRARSFRSVIIRGALVQMGPHRIDRQNWDWDEVDANPFFAPDAEVASLGRSFLDGIRKIRLILRRRDRGRGRRRAGGLGRADLRQARPGLAGAMMSINAVKGVEIGAGFAAAALTGEENAR